MLSLDRKRTSVVQIYHGCSHGEKGFSLAIFHINLFELSAEIEINVDRIAR